MDDPQVRHREMVIEDASGNEHIGIPIKFRHEPGEVDFNVPMLGEHNEVIAASLGYDLKEIERLKREGVLGG